MSARQRRRRPPADRRGAAPERALAGRCILVTRPPDQANDLSDALRARGAKVIEAPAIRIEPPSDWARLDRALDELQSYDWILFTSGNAVRSFFERLEHRARPSTARLGPRLAAVGPKTALALSMRGMTVDLQPERFVAEEVFRALTSEGSLEGVRFLLPRSNIARKTLPELLRSKGARVEEVVAYRTVAAEGEMRPAVEQVMKGDVDLVTFTSGSAARSFMAQTSLADGDLHENLLAASIGPVTTAILKELGVQPVIEASEHTTEGLVEAISRFYRS